MVVIRPEGPDDAEAVAGVHVRGWQAGYAGVMPAEVLDRLNVAAWARRRREVGTADPDHPFTTLVAVDGDAVTGFVTFGPYRVEQDRDRLDPDHGEVLGLYVEPARWGSGLGRALLVAAAAGLAGRGWADLRLWVLRDNPRARRFYERAGLTPDGERSTYTLRQSAGRPPLGLVELRYAARLDRLREPAGR